MGRSGGLDHGGPLDDAAAVVIVDVELFEEAPAEGPEQGFDGLLTGVLQRDRAPGPAIVAPGRAQPADDVAEDLAAMAAELAAADRDLEEVVEEAGRDRPVHLVEPDEEVGQLRDDV